MGELGAPWGGKRTAAVPVLSHKGCKTIASAVATACSFLAAGPGFFSGYLLTLQKLDSLGNHGMASTSSRRPSPEPGCQCSLLEASLPFQTAPQRCALSNALSPQICLINADLSDSSGVSRGLRVAPNPGRGPIWLETSQSFPSTLGGHPAPPIRSIRKDNRWGGDGGWGIGGRDSLRQGGVRGVGYTVWVPLDSLGSWDPRDLRLQVRSWVRGCGVRGGLAQLGSRGAAGGGEKRGERGFADGETGCWRDSGFFWGGGREMELTPYRRHTRCSSSRSCLRSGRCCPRRRRCPWSCKPPCGSPIRTACRKLAPGN